MKEISLKCCAKINLSLNIAGAVNGYHMLDTLAASVSPFEGYPVVGRDDHGAPQAGWFDEIIIKKRADKKINLICNIDIPGNNVIIAAEKFINKYGCAGADIILNKNIPISGGLGGSSADIALIIKGLSMLHGIKDDIELCNELGSDCAYMLHGGFARLKGKGDIIEKLDFYHEFKVLIVKPPYGITARECFKAYDENPDAPRNDTQKCINALKNNNLNEFYANMYNALEAPALKIKPSLDGVRRRLESLNPNAVLMSGSGSCMFALFDANAETPPFNDLFKDEKVFVCKTVKEGMLIN